MYPFYIPKDPSHQHSSNPYTAPPSYVTEPLQETDTGPFHPFASIWFHPRMTMRRIMARDPDLYVIRLVCIAGIGETLNQASFQNWGDQIPLSFLLGTAYILGPISSLIQLYISSLLILWTGTWIGGIATSNKIRTAIAWSYLPEIAAILLWIPQFALLGEGSFKSETIRMELQPLQFCFRIGMFLVQAVLGIWGFFLLCNTLAEVQGYKSAWQGLANLLLASVVIIIPFFLLAFLFLFIFDVV